MTPGPQVSREHEVDGLGTGGLSRRGFLGAAAALGLAAGGSGLLAACTSSSAAKGQTTKGKPRRGGTLTVGTGAAGTTDTLDAMSSPSYAQSYMSHVFYDQLADFTNDFKYELQLAESVESNKDGTVWTVRVKPDIEFHNGKTLSADDVIYTFHRIFTLPSATTKSEFAGFVDPKGFKKLDARTVQISMLTPYATFARALASPTKIIPVGYDPKKPVGTGPFTYKSLTPGRQWVCERYANYWNARGPSQASDSPAPSSLGARPYLDELVVTVINDDSARVNALLTGQVDAINLVPFAQIPIIKRHANLNILEAKTGRWTGVYMNMAVPPFNDVRVRQALRLSIDRQQALQSCLSGHGTIANDMYSVEDPSYPKDLVRHRDLKQARALLKAAGKEGVTVGFATSPVTSDAVAMATVIAHNAAEAGFNIKVHQTDVATMYGTNYGNWILSQDTWPPLGDFLTQASAIDISTAKDVMTHQKDPEFDRLYAQAQATTDESARNAIKTRMQKILFERGGWIIPYFPNVVNAYSSKTGGWPKNDFAGRSFGNAQFHQVYLTE